MIDPYFPSENLMYATTLLRVTTADGESIGTGFFYSFEIEPGKSVLAIVTNRHVVAGAIQILAQIHTGRPPEVELLSIQLDGQNTHLIRHPNEEIDLAAYVIFDFVGQVKRGAGKTPFISMFSKAVIPSSEDLASLSATTDVTMAGYPVGMIDERWGMPIMRRGVTAIHPALSYSNRNIGRESVGVLDMACFWGSSGSPICVINEGAFMTKSGALMSGNRMYFLGVAFAMGVLPREGEVQAREIPTSAPKVVPYEMPLHITYYEKAASLEGFIAPIRRLFKIDK